MLEHLSDFICGWRLLTVLPEERSRTFDLLYRNGISFSGERREPGGLITVRLREKNAQRFCRDADECGIAYRIGPLCGLPVTAAFLLHRPALPLGVLLAAGWLFYSTRIIWDVRIDGTQKTDPAEIIALLDELGCGIGDYFPSIDFNELHAKYAAVQHDIAWLSVYMNGTVAEVQVRELWPDDRVKPEKTVCANVLAEADGVVEVVNVFEGQALVKPGDVVRKGQVVISGTIEQKDGTVRYEYAAGEVICRTACPIRTEIQTKRETKSYTGREITRKRIKFFKKIINLFINSGTLYPNYDKIDTIEQLCPFGLCEIPVWCETITCREYETVWQDIPAEEAAEEAMTRLTAQIRAVSQDAELLSRRIDTRFEDGVYIMDALLYLRCDIGCTEEFPLPDNGDPLSR